MPQYRCAPFKAQKGFTIIELMMVIVVLGVLVGIALPAYQDYVRKSNRSVAKGKLLELSSLQEQYFGDYKVYANTLDLFFGFGEAQAGADTSFNFVDKDDDDAIYVFTVATSAVGGVDRMAYTLTATPKAGSIQAADTECASFSLTDTGARSATSDECWD